MRSFFVLSIFSLFIGRAFADPVTSPPAHDPMEMPLHETRYYRVYTDLDPAEAQEACVRMTKMAEEYHNRTADFAGQITTKLPFYLFKNAEEYYAAGGPPQTAGVFDGISLKAMADRRLGRQVWHVVQHEGFHQFVHAVIGGELPIWVNEGMAEYFGEGIFTGDGMVTGIIPPWRMQRVLRTMNAPEQAGGFHTLASIMALSHPAWNAEMSQQNYDQAWSMVQFLAHGDNGKYQQAFGQYMGAISRGHDPGLTWNGIFGSDTVAFDRRWREYWTSLSPSPTSDLYARATVATLTSFLARAFDQKQTFENFDAFLKAASNGTLHAGPEEVLPASLIDSAVRDVLHRREMGDRFSFDFGKPPARPVAGPRIPQLICDTAEGQHFVGKFTTRGPQVLEVTVTVTGTRHALPTSNTAIRRPD